MENVILWLGVEYPSHSSPALQGILSAFQDDGTTLGTLVHAVMRRRVGKNLVFLEFDEGVEGDDGAGYPVEGIGYEEGHCPDVPG